jgi:hypothetical protein
VRRRIWTLAGGVAVLAAVVAVPTALATQYSSAKLTVTQATGSTTVKASLDPNDDATASVRITAPAGTRITANQAPGTVLGPVKAIVKALDLAGADLPLDGQLVVAAPGQVPAAQQAACLQSTSPTATWVMVLSAAGQTLQVPTYLVAPAGGLAYIQICLPPPDVPVGTPGRATFGAKVYSAELAISGVFSSVASGAWIGFWTPYNPGVGSVNLAGTIATPAAVAPGAVTLAAKRSGKGAALAGSVTQGGAPRAGAAVTILGGTKATGLKRIGTARTGASGKFAFRARSGTFFRAAAVAAPGSAPAVCAQLAATLAPIPCVNATSNGFAAQSKVVKKR